MATTTTTDVATSLNAGDAPTPTTPRPTSSLPQPSADDTTTTTATNESGPRTPTRQHFGDNSIVNQENVPAEPVTPAQQRDKSSEPPMSVSSQQQHRPTTAGSMQESEDTEMMDADDGGAGGDEDGSDNDSVTSESTRLSKKKKGQRFFCTDYPPCQLSFTRSEHLARHIRKHTGERPFQCHCSRRFSRLDNLRQHAQTVHLGEDIPDGSLAATSTRFQRQIRTDRVRPPGSRSRANTMGSSGGGPSRGHSRNVSTSSIGSTSSNVSGLEETRKRPLAMAADPSPRARPHLDTYGQMPGGGGGGGGGAVPYPYYNQSPTGYSTPTSTVFSADIGSPRFGSSMASPTSTVSRSSFYDGPSHGRRLSVPSAHNPFQGHMGGGTYPPQYYGAPMQMGGMPVFTSNQGSVFSSPTSSVYSHSRRESEAELEWRRRTWHPGTNTNYSQRPATSGLSYHQTPDDTQPAPSQQPAASQLTRLPGIESFDITARQQTSPMTVEASPRPTSSGRPVEAAAPQQQQQQPQQMARLDIAAANAPVEGQWQAVQQPQGAPPQGYYVPQQQQPQGVQQHPQAPQQQQQQQQQPEPVTPRRNKRQAWYGGPVNQNQPQASTQPQPQHHSNQAYATQRPSPEDSGSSDGVPTPSTSQVSEYHPVIINPNGGVPEPGGPMYAHGGPHVVMAAEEQAHQAPKTYALQAGHDPSSTFAAGAGAVHHHPFAHHHHPSAAAGGGGDPSHHSHHPHQFPPHSANHDMGRLEALVAVATSEGRAVERS